MKPTEPDVIVVGAGALGCNAAWHLRRRGMKVLVIEATDGVATQATRAAAGFVGAWSAIHAVAWGKTEWQMQRYGIEFYTHLGQTCGRDIGFRACGIAYIYTHEAAWREVQPRIDEARRLGTKLEILDQSRCAQLIPLINFDRVAGIIFDPDAIKLRAGDAIPALADQSQREGVQFQFNTRVTGFRRNGSRVGGVRTEQGETASQHIVVAAGAWSRPLIESAGVQCPAKPLVYTRYTTKPLPGVGPDLPLLIFSDCHGFYIREERGGLLIGGDDESPVPTDRFVTSGDPPCSNKIPPDQAYRVRTYLKQIEHVMPVLKVAEIEAISSGLPTLTDDTHFIADGVPGMNGLFVLAACQAAGVTHGPGLGHLIAELIADGTTQWDNSAYRLGRFVSPGKGKPQCLGNGKNDEDKTGIARAVRAARLYRFTGTDL